MCRFEAQSSCQNDECADVIVQRTLFPKPMICFSFQENQFADSPVRTNVAKTTSIQSALQDIARWNCAKAQFLVVEGGGANFDRIKIARLS